MLYLIMAEVQRFELWRGLHPLSVFKTDPFNHLGKLPDVMFTNWWTIQDLNPKPIRYERTALTN